HHFITNNKMRHITHIMNSYNASKITADNGGIIDPTRQTKVTKMEINVIHVTYADKTIKFGMLNLFRKKLIRDQNIIPIIGIIVISDQDFNFFLRQLSKFPMIGKLLITEMIFVTILQVGLRDKMVS